MPEFEWDEEKEKSNKKKHNISFEDATDIFNDEDRINLKSDKNGEERFKVIGKAYEAIIVVIYTIRELAVRIITARRARKEERRKYLSKKLSKNDDIKN